MFRKRFLSLLTVGMLLAAVSASLAPAQAATTAIGKFYAGCNNFSVEVAVTGNHDDGGGVDKFRYWISDGNNKKLYVEDATRPVNVTGGSVVYNLPYDADGVVDGQPGKNPITFTVFDLDGNNNVIGTLQQVTYNADCLPAASTAVNRSGVVIPQHNVFGTMIASVPFYQGPGTGQLGLTAAAGKVFNTVYRSGDAQWVAVYSGGPQLLWVPIAGIKVDVTQLNVPPSRIDGSSLTPSGNVVGGYATGVTGRALVDLNVRNQPSLNGKILTVIPFRAVVPVLGRNSAGTWVKVLYNGTYGWSSAFFFIYSGGTRLGLPVVQ